MPRSPVHRLGGHPTPASPAVADARARGFDDALLGMWFDRVPAVPFVRAIELLDPPRAGRTLAMSAHVERLLGYTSAELLADPDLWPSRIYPDDLAHVIAAWRSAAAPGDRYCITYRIRNRDEQLLRVLDVAAVTEDESGARSWAGVVVDVTEHGADTATVSEAEERYRLLVEQIPAVTYIDEVPADDPADLTPIYMSPQIERLLGYMPHEWLADPDLWNRVTHPDDIDDAETAASRAFKEGTPLSIEYRMIARDGRTKWVREEAALYRDDHGVPRFWQGVYFDITELKRAEDELNNALVREREAAERLRTLDELKNTFLQAVSHDLRTPLAAIYGLARTLEQRDLALEDDEARDMAARIANNSGKLARMVSDLLDLDRLSRGILEPKLRDADLGDVVREVVEQLDVAERRTIKLDAVSVTVPVDVAKVERIVENLIVNTLRHTPAGTQVWVRTGAMPGGAEIVVEDDGPGVPRELHDAIFEPFRQGPSESSHAPGAGIGLALVSRFAELHGGRAWVEDRPGGGASFRVFLPSA
jgi:PAS domain S-box-containing protein